MEKPFRNSNVFVMEIEISNLTEDSAWKTWNETVAEAVPGSENGRRLSFPLKLSLNFWRCLISTFEVGYTINKKY